MRTPEDERRSNRRGSHRFPLLAASGVRQTDDRSWRIGSLKADHGQQFLLTERSIKTLRLQGD